MNILVSLTFIGFGIWTFISPKDVVAFKIKLLRSIGIEVKIIAPPKAYKSMKYLGLGIAVVGFLLYFS